MPPRARMWLILSQFREPLGAMPGGVTLRPAAGDDAEALAWLLLDAYRGTLDDAGEAIDDARDEIKRIQSGFYGPLIAEASLVAADPEGKLVSAALVVAAARPMLLYLVTHPDHQRRTLGAILLARAARALPKLGHVDLWLGVHPGNEHAIKLYERVGFVFA